MEQLPYTKDHEDFRRRLRGFLKQAVIPSVDKWEKDHIIPREIWREMGREGFLCPCVSTEYGGLGKDFLYTAIVIEEMVKTNHTGLFVQLHSDVVVPYIESFGTPEQKNKYLPGCVNGEIVTAVAMTEPDAGSDLSSMSSTAIEDGDNIILNGVKTFISNAVHCDLAVVAAKDPNVKSSHQAVSLYLVESDTPGFEKGKAFDKMGMHSQDTAELFFSNCRIPKKNRLGEKGQGFIMLMQKLQQERLVCAKWCTAIAESILDWTLNYCKKTEKNGKLLTTSQACQFALVEMYADLRIGKAFLNDLIMDHISAKQVVNETSMAKFWFSEKANQIANRCLEIVERNGMIEDSPIVRMFRDVRIHTIFAGTNEIMRQIIAKSIL